jgi:pSer/pThr/pTyr-binding forkhead associated (FHA) protein
MSKAWGDGAFPRKGWLSMRDQGRESGSPLWADGEITLRIEATARESERVVRIDRPFALVGRDASSEVRIADPAVNGRHAYLHLDPRGVYAVDLVTRSGTRLSGTDEMAGWLRPGDWLEFAGRRIELLRARIGGVLLDPPPCSDDPLAEAGHRPLAALTLVPRRGPDSPWTVGSELIFLGWSRACGIQVRDAAVAKVHCALVRTASGASVVDLSGRPLRVDDRPVQGVSALDDGASLTVGATPFAVRVGPPSARCLPPPSRPSPLVARVISPELVQDSDDARSLDLVPAESQQAMLAWMVDTLRQTQGAVLRQQGEMQATLAGMLRQVQHDNAALLNAHLERIERIDRELGALRAELAGRSAGPVPPPPPQATPLRIERKAPAPANSQASTTWLLERVNQLENENRSAWKDLLGRLPSSPRRAP